MSYYKLYDLEEQITACWNVLTEVKALDEAILETDISNEDVSKILSGLKELYQVKFDKLHVMMRCTIDSDFEQLMFNCWQVVDELELIHEFLNKIEMSKDKLSNTLMGVEFLYELKFNKFWNHYMMLLEKEKSRQCEENRRAKTYVTETKEVPDGSGDVMVELPQEMLDNLGWKVGDVLDYKLVNGQILVEKRSGVEG